MLLPMLSTGAAGLFGFAAAISIRPHSEVFLDVSVSLLAVGLVWAMILGMYLVWHDAQGRKAEQSKERVS